MSGIPPPLCATPGGAQFFHYGAAFRIAAANRARGHRPAGLRALFRLWLTQRRLMASYPPND